MEKTKKLILVVDTQYDFMLADGRLPVPGAEEIIVPGIRFLAGLTPETTAGVIFTFDSHTSETYLDSPENLGNPDQGLPGFPLHCEKGTPGWENVFNPGLIRASIPLYQLEKPVFDPWATPGATLVERPVQGAGEAHVHLRDEFFSPQRAGSEVVVVIGVASDYCVRWAVAGLVARNFQVEVSLALTRGIQREFDRVKRDHFAEAPVRLV